MLVVTVELWPRGDATKRVHLGTAYIANTATGDAANGNYAVTLTKIGRQKQVWKRGTVTGFPRLRLGAWDLLYRGLRDVVGERNP